MTVNPDRAVETIDSLLERIDEISKKEYDEEATVKEFGELVVEVRRFVRNSGIKQLKDQDWYFEYCEFDGWTRNGVPVGNLGEFFDGPTVGQAYEYDINNLKTILDGCRKDFEMIKKLKGKRQQLISLREEKKNDFAKKFLPIEGKWDTSKWESGKSLITYVEPYKKPKDGKDPRNVALALFEGEMKKGVIKTKVRFAERGSRIARIVIGYDSETGGYYSVGIGGYRIAYLIDRYDKHIGWRAIYSKGDIGIIERGKTYQIEVEFNSKIIILKIDNAEIFRYSLPENNLGKQVGFFSWGAGNVVFSDIEMGVVRSSVAVEKKLFYAPEDKINIASAAFENGDSVSVFNNLNTALELILKDILDIPTTKTNIHTADIINIMVKHGIGPIEHLKEVKKHVLSIDNKSKHQGFNPSEIQSINALKSMEDFMSKLNKSDIILTEVIKNKLFKRK